MKKTSLATAVAIACFTSGCSEPSSKPTAQVAPSTPVIEASVAKSAEKDLETTTKQNASTEQTYIKASKALFLPRPMSASMFGLTEELAGGYYQTQMDDYSVARENQLRQELRAVTQSIKNLPDSTNVQTQENKEVMASITRYYAGHEDFPIGYIDAWMGLSAFIVNQINGPLIDIPSSLQNQHVIQNAKDAQDYLTRLAQFDDLVKSVSEKLSADVAQNWIAPKTNLKGALVYIDSFLSSEAKGHPIVNTLKEKLAKLENMPQSDADELIAKAEALMVEEVYPAYQAMHKQVTELLPKARTESGIWAQPNGAKFYQDAIKQLGDSDLSAEQIHQIGLDEVKRISEQMDAILKEQGYSNGSVGERMSSLTDEDRFLYADSNEGRAELLADLNKYIVEITEKMTPVFATKPKYEVEVRAFPVEVQDGAAGGMYNAPSMDGSKPGIYWINLKDMKANAKFGLKTLTYHEANPGHHWQVALNLEQDSLPFLRRIAPYNAYVEGWALYSELVAYELGMYENDPFGNLGRLQAELFRAVRLVVDTGMHHKRWTREQAIDYMAKTTGSAMSDVVSEIERYMAWPGQALGYKLGMLKIVELREQAKTKLGDKFDIAAFHDLVLLGGAVPMSVLEAKVNRWVNAQ